MSFSRQTPRWVMLATAGMLALAAVVYANWAYTANFQMMAWYFRYPNGLFLLGSALVECRFAWLAWSAFEEDEPLELAWFLMVLAAAFRVTGTLIAHIIVPTMPATNGVDPALLRDAGLVISGPFSLLTLGAGLLLVLRTYRRLGFAATPAPVDYLWIVASAGFALRQLYEIAIYFPVLKHSKSLPAKLLWFVDPLLCVLLIVAILLYRHAKQMHGGYVSQCWSTYAVAAILTTLGDVGIWAVNYRYVVWPHFSITWLIWIPAAAAFALAPCYQVCAAAHVFELRDAETAD